jgi:hypothetical protein
MAILRPMLMPTVGIPQNVVASRRPRNMSQKDFYSQGLSSQARRLQQFSGGQEQPQSEFEQEPVTGNYIQSQLERINQRAAPPQLEPIGRVKSAEAELVQPSSFQNYYKQLESIRGISQERTGADLARALFQRLQSQATIGSGSTGGSRPSGGKGKNYGNDYGGGIPSNPKANFRFAQELGPQFGWGPEELSAWYTLGMKESGWRNTAQNPTSTAYGIGQFLNSTWKGVGMTKTSDPRLQVLAMAKYIRNRYGSPSRALAFHKRNNWY